MIYEKAKKWAEKKLSAEKYEEIFGEVTEDEGRSTLHLSLDNSIISRVKQNAGKLGISVSEYFTNLVLLDK